MVASPHEIRGNIVKAFVILNEGYKASDDLVKTLQDFTKKTVAPPIIKLRDAERQKYNQQFKQ